MLYYQIPLDQALDAVQLYVVPPLDGAHLFGPVLFQQPVAVATEVHIVIHVQGHIAEVVKTQRQLAVTL